MTIHPSPPGTEPAQVVITVLDAAGRPVTGAAVTVEGNMSHAGMAPVQSAADEVSPGTYVTRDFAFAMGGDWLLTVGVKPSAGKPFERTISVKGVAGGQR